MVGGYVYINMVLYVFQQDDNQMYSVSGMPGNLVSYCILAGNSSQGIYFYVKTIKEILLTDQRDLTSGLQILFDYFLCLFTSMPQGT